MSPTHNGSSVLQCFERGNAIKIHNRIMFDFYLGLPHMYVMQLMSLPHVAKHETDCGQKSGYHAAINDCGLRSASTVDQFASSFLTSTKSDTTFSPRMHKVSTGPNTHRGE